MKGHKFADDDVICVENCQLEVKIDNSSTTESELCRNAGPSAFQLQECMSKSDKIGCRYHVINCVSLQTF